MPTEISKPKTFATFEKFRQELFCGNPHFNEEHPFTFAIERCNHDIQKLEELISVAEGVEGKTIKARLDGWKRQLARRKKSRERLLSLVGESMADTTSSSANSMPA